MSRWGAGRATAAAVGAAMLLLPACAQPPGVDGDMVGGWGAMPEPEPWTPAAGVCHNTDYRQVVPMASSYSYRPVDCTEEHRIETVHVGFFDGEIAERSGPPRPGSSDWRSTYQVCDSEAAAYLGADFRHGFLWLGVVVPSEAGWQGGARWFRCDLAETQPHPRVPRPPGSLRGALAEPSGLSLGCFNLIDLELPGSVEGRVDFLDDVECTEPHDAEFVGVWRAGSSRYLESDADLRRIHRGCREQAAAYVGVPVGQDLIHRTGTIFDPIGEEDWANGDRGFRCYLWLAGEELTESLAGAGPRGLPVR